MTADAPDGLFTEEDIPLPPGGDNLAAVRHAIAAAAKSGRLLADDAALIRAAETGARALDRAERAPGDKAAYAFAAAMRSYQDVLSRLGLNGRADLPTGGGDGAAAALIKALGSGPT